MDLGGARNASPPVHLFHFHAAFGNNNRLATTFLGLVPPSGDSLDSFWNVEIPQFHGLRG